MWLNQRMQIAGFPPVPMYAVLLFWIVVSVLLTVAVLEGKVVLDEMLGVNQESAEAREETM